MHWQIVEKVERGKEEREQGRTRERTDAPAYIGDDYISRYDPDFPMHRLPVTLVATLFP